MWQMLIILQSEVPNLFKSYSVPPKGHALIGWFQSSSWPVLCWFWVGDGHIITALHWLSVSPDPGFVRLYWHSNTQGCLLLSPLLFQSGVCPSNLLWFLQFMSLTQVSVVKNDGRAVLFDLRSRHLFLCSWPGSTSPSVAPVFPVEPQIFCCRSWSLNCELAHLPARRKTVHVSFPATDIKIADVSPLPPITLKWKPH